MKSLLFLGFMISAFLLSAQHIGYLMPSGGQQGTEVEILVGGQNMWGKPGAMVTGEGVTVKNVYIVPGVPYIPWRQKKYLTEWLRNLQDGKKVQPKKPEDPEMIKDWRKHIFFDTADQLPPLKLHILNWGLFVPRNPLQMSPAINQQAIITLRIAPDARPGRRELRLIVAGNRRVSNPLPFYIDRFQEYREPFMMTPPKKAPDPEFTYPAILNGQIMPGQKDNWFFNAQKGDHLLFKVFARQLVPFLGDCVPGYFQCVLEIVDSKNKTVGFADDHGNDPDPHLQWTVPENGRYRLVVRDALYRGRADFVYRIQVTQGTESLVLPPPPTTGLPLKSIASLKNGEVGFPVMLLGSIRQNRSSEKVTIRLKKGEKIVAETYARRVNMPLDTMLTVFGPDGKQIASNDDYKHFNVGTIMQNTDSYLCFTVPADGKYTFQVTDKSSLSMKSVPYYLRISRPMPTFRIALAPSAQVIPVNGCTPVKILIEPVDGFSGDIVLGMETPMQEETYKSRPRKKGEKSVWVKKQITSGYRIAGSNIIPAGACQSMITLTSRWNNRVKDNFKPMRAVLTAKSTAAAIPGSIIFGDESMQAFAYTHIVPAEEWIVTKGWVPHGGHLVRHADAQLTRIKMKPGGTYPLKLTISKQPEKTSYQFSFQNAPAGLSIAKIDWGKIDAKKNQTVILTIAASASMKKQRFNQSVTGRFDYRTNPNKEGKVFQRTSIFSLPALLYEIGE